MNGLEKLQLIYSLQDSTLKLEAKKRGLKDYVGGFQLKKDVFVLLILIKSELFSFVVIRDERGHFHDSISPKLDYFILNYHEMMIWVETDLERTKKLYA